MDMAHSHVGSTRPAAPDLSTREGRRAAAERVADIVEAQGMPTGPRQAARVLWRDPSLARWLGVTPGSERAHAARNADERMEMVDDPAEAHLVSSLCTDGLHRPAFDCDYAVTATPAGDGRTFVTFDTTPDEEAWRHVRDFMNEKGWVAISGAVNFNSGGRPSLLFTVPVAVVPSSSPGHFHLYIEAPLVWAEYRELLELVHAANIIVGSTVPFSIERGHSLLLRPGLSKARVRAQLELSFCSEAVGQ